MLVADENFVFTSAQANDVSFWTTAIKDKSVVLFPKIINFEAAPTEAAYEETNFGIWGGEEYIPQNYDGLFRGEVTLREALAQSLNVPSVKVLAEFAGLRDSIALAKELGITTLDKDPSFYGLSLVLGGGEVRLLDIASAYGVFAQRGKKTPPLSVI